MVVLFLVIIILMRVLQSLFSKKANLIIPDGVKSYMKHIGISKLFSSVFGLVLIILESRNLAGINLQMIAIASVSGLALAIGSLCGIKALSNGTLVLNSMFGAAGLIVPCILGIFLFDEPISFMQGVCMAVLFFAMAMLVDSSKKISKKISKKTILYLIGSLLSNGTVMFCQKLFGELEPDGNVSFFSMITFLIPAAVILCVLPLVPEKAEDTKKFPKKLIVYALILAFAVFVIQQLVTLLTPLLSSAVLFTFVNGGATVIAALVGAAVYSEKITVKSALGIILGIAAMIGMKVF